MNKNDGGGRRERKRVYKKAMGKSSHFEGFGGGGHE